MKEELLHRVEYISVCSWCYPNGTGIKRESWQYETATCCPKHMEEVLKGGIHIDIMVGKRKEMRHILTSKNEK